MSTTNLYHCRECEGTGVIVELNAYDPEYRLELPCDFCGGVGFVKRNEEYHIVTVDVDPLPKGN